MDTLPDSVFELLALVQAGLEWESQLPDRLRNALDIAVGHGLVTMQGFQFSDDAQVFLTDAGRGESALHAEGGSTPKKRRRRRGPDVQKLTVKQRVAIEIVADCQGDFAKAARRLGKDRKTVKQHYDAGMKKMGEAIGRKPKVKSLPTGSRGESEATAEDDPRARIRPTDRRRRD